MPVRLRLAAYSPVRAEPVLDAVLAAWGGTADAGLRPDVVQSPAGLDAHAVRMTLDDGAVASLRDAVRQARTDAAVVLVPQRLLDAPRILLVTDVDSTLIEQEVIELLAAHAGREKEVAAVTERAMRGELDFAQSLHHRVKALEGLPVSVIEDVAAKVTPTAGAQELIDAAHRAGHLIGAVSGGFKQVLDPLADRLGLDHARANVLGVRDGKLTGEVVGGVVDRAAKRQALLEWAASNAVDPEATVGLGDGANDLDLTATATLGIGVQPKPALRERVDGVLDLRRLDVIASSLDWPLH